MFYRLNAVVRENMKNVQYVCDVAKCVPMYLVSITMLNHTNVFVENYDVWNNKNV